MVRPLDELVGIIDNTEDDASPPAQIKPGYLSARSCVPPSYNHWQLLTCSLVASLMHTSGKMNVFRPYCVRGAVTSASKISTICASTEQALRHRFHMHHERSPTVWGPSWEAFHSTLPKVHSVVKPRTVTGPISTSGTALMRWASQALLAPHTWKNSARPFGDSAIVGGASLPPPAQQSEPVSRTLAAKVYTA